MTRLGVLGFRNEKRERGERNGRDKIEKKRRRREEKEKTLSKTRFKKNGPVSGPGGGDQRQEKWKNAKEETRRFGTGTNADGRGKKQGDILSCLSCLSLFFVFQD